MSKFNVHRRSSAGIAAVLMLVMAGIAASSTGANAEIIPTSGVNSMTGNYSGWAVQIIGIYATQAAAQSAALAWVAPPGSSGTACTDSAPGWSGGYAADAGMIDNAKWGAVARKKGQYHTYFPCGNNTNEQVDFIWPKQAGVYVDSGVDADSDGVPDYLDPYPTDPTPFKFKVISESFNAQGARTWIMIQTDRGDYLTFGTKSGSDINYMNVGGAWLDGTQLDNELGSWASSTKTVTEGRAPTPTIPTVTTPTGTDNTGNTVDTDYLADVVNNSKTAIDQNNLTNQLLKSIAESVQQNTQAVQGAGSGAGGGGGGGGGTPAQTEEGVGAALDARTTSAGDFSGITSEYPGLQEGDIPVKESITDTLTNHPISGVTNSIKGFFTGSSVDASGSCSFSWNWKGQSISFSMCQWSSQLQFLGFGILALAGFYSLMIAMGRA